MRELFRRLGPRRSVSPPVGVVLWGKPDCSLCDKANAIVERLARDYPLTVDKRDITEDATAFERYRLVIPVVEIEGGPRFEGKVTEHRIRIALEELRSGREALRRVDK